MEIKLNVTGLGEYKVTLRKGSYPGGGVALRLIDFEDGAPFATITVNIPEQNSLLGPGEFFVKAWSENEAVVNALREKSEIFLDTGRRVDVSDLATAEIWKFADDTIVDQLKPL